MATRTIEEMKAELATLGGGMQNLERISQIAYEMDAYVRSGNVAASELEAAKAFALSDLQARGGSSENAEALGADIVSRDTGKAATKQKQAKRMAGMTGATSPRTRQQTASLLSSASAAPSTLLG